MTFFMIKCILKFFSRCCQSNNYNGTFMFEVWIGNSYFNCNINSLFNSINSVILLDISPTWFFKEFISDCCCCFSASSGFNSVKMRSKQVIISLWKSTLLYNSKRLKHNVTIKIKIPLSLSTQGDYKDP